MVTLHHDTADTTAGGYPHVVVLILGDTTDIIVAETLFLCQIVQTVVLEVENVQTFSGTNPDQTAGVLKYLGDIVVRERLDIRGVTRQYRLFRIRQVQDDESFSRSDIEVIALTVVVVEQTGDVIRT